MGARSGYYNYTSALTGKLLVPAALPDSGTSNICLGCHLGRAAGGGRDAIEDEAAQRPVVRRHRPLALEHVDFH